MNNETTLGKIKSKGKAKSTVFANAKVKSIALKVGASLLIVGLLLGGYWKYTQVTKDKILPKVTVAGIKIGGKTPEEAKTIVQNYVDKINTNGPEITYEDQTIKPKLSEMGATFDVDRVIDDAYRFGRNSSLKDKVRENAQMVFKNYNITLNPQIDEQKLDEYLGQIAKVVEVTPENARLTINNGNISVVPSKDGRGLDKEKLEKDLNSLINSGNINGKITLVTTTLKPDIIEEGTVEAQKDAQRYMAAAPITVTFESSSWTADKADIGAWIKFAESGSKITTSANPSSFIEYIAEQVEIAANPKEIQDGTGATLSEGNDGRGVDKEVLSNQIKNALNNSQSGTFALVTFVIPKGEKIIYPHAQPGRYAGRYIDVNLSEQTLYAFDGNTLVNQFLVSTGKAGTPTPTGEFNIWGKSRSTLMDGPGYYLPNVEWVSWVVGDYSIHGTYWHSNFGTPMSHGCINASNSDAEWVYNFVDVGTPVYIHY